MKTGLKVFFLFFIFGLLIYSNSLNNKFLMDDYVFLKNPILSGTKFMLSQWNPYREQASGVMDNNQGNLPYYRPMAHMLYDLCYAHFKNNFWQYHLLNLFLFVLASFLIYLLIEKSTGNYNLAFLSGLFYLIHPINGIMVNYISASVFIFQLIFMLGAILLLWESLEQKNNRALYFLSLFCSFLCLFWHESGMLIPFYVCAFILIFRKDPFKSKTLYLFPYFLIVVSYAFLRTFFIANHDNILRKTAIFHMTTGEYLASLFQLFAWYISKLFCPHGIVMQWVTFIAHDHIILNVSGLCVFFMISLLFFIRSSKEKICQLAIAWVLIGFAPVFWAAVRLMNGAAEIEPHWFVFSSMGFFILAAYFCLIVVRRIGKIGFVLPVILVLGWATVSHAYNKLWADQKTYALYWSQQVPILAFPRCVLADAYKEEGKFAESLKYYSMGLSGDPSDQDTYNSMGAIYLTEGRLKEAELNFTRALKINPRSSIAYNNLGALCLKQGQWDKAEGFYRQALAYNPLLLGPRWGLIRILLNHSDYQKAIELCRINLDIADDDTNTLRLLIDIYIHQKDTVNIKKYADQIINYEIDPEVLTDLGSLMAQNNVPDAAMDCFKKVLQVAPDYKDAYLALGELLAHLGKYDQAIHIWQLGSSIDLSDDRFKQHIVKVEEFKLK